MSLQALAVHCRWHSNAQLEVLGIGSFRKDRSGRTAWDRGPCAYTLTPRLQLYRDMQHLHTSRREQWNLVVPHGPRPHLSLSPSWPSQLALRHPVFLLHIHGVQGKLSAIS